MNLLSVLGYRPIRRTSNEILLLELRSKYAEHGTSRFPVRQNILPHFYYSWLDFRLAVLSPDLKPNS